MVPGRQRPHHPGPDGAARWPAVRRTHPAATPTSLFASFIRSEEGGSHRREAGQGEAAAADHLMVAKDDAAAELKRIRWRSGVSAEERAEAEEAYRRAGAVVAEGRRA